jgi:hypothetical protein
VNENNAPRPLWSARCPRFETGDIHPQSLSENVAAGILACRRGRHPAARKDRSDEGTLKSTNGVPDGDAIPPGWKPRLYVSQDGRRYHFQTGF